VAFLSATPIDLATLIAGIESPAHGGIASFLGQVRDHHDGRVVRRLEYSAYGPMAEEECARIVAEAKERWPVRVALMHRVGMLDIGDTAVAVAAAGAHRDEAFAACRFVIEEVKRRVPIWKKEFYQDGAVQWVDPARGAGEVTHS
jgi:molybdopterin synthase catalytic subunit